MNLPAIINELSMKQRVGAGAALAGVVVVLFMLMSLATKPSYTTLMSGIEPAKSDKITEALASRGVAYELRDGGTSLAVEKKNVADARIALANAGVSGGSADHPGFELLDEQKLGSSDFQQRITYQRALEGEIAKTISRIDGVTGAEVQLTLPEDKLFSSEEQPATAAVLLSGQSSALDAGQVKGVANLVASSVRGLKTDKVTITDGEGQMLWPNGDSAGGAATASAKAAAEARYASQIEADVNAMLSRSLGPGKARVEVSAELNMDDVDREQLVYDRRGTVLDRTVETERLRGEGAQGGTAGTAANIDGTRAAGGAGGSNYDKTNRKENFGVGKTVTKTKVAPGAVEGMQVALLVDESVAPPAAPSLIELQDMVSAAAGLKADRGDTITATQMKFAAPPEPAGQGLPITPTGVLDVLKYVLAALAALAFLLVATRALRRRELAELAEPTWLSEIEQPRPLSELVASIEAENAEEQALAEQSAREQLAAVAAQDPERLARQLREWMSDGGTPAAVAAEATTRPEGGTPA